MHTPVAARVPLRSCAGFFPISAKGSDLVAQLVLALSITAGDRHRKGEVKLLELMAAFGITALTAGGGAGAGSGGMALCEGHGSLSSHCGTVLPLSSG